MDCKNYRVDSERILLEQIIQKHKINIINEHEIKLLKKLSSGGFGEVQIGEHNNSKVVVKIMFKLKVKDYTDEIVNVNKFRHPNIPKFIGIYDIISKKTFGLIYEYIEGITMTNQIKLEKKNLEKNQISLVQKLDYMTQLCSVIELLHDSGLIHRDLKTDNILIDTLGNLKLIDFGIAISDDKASLLDIKNDFACTWNYVAPELINQSILEGQADINEDIITEAKKYLTKLNNYFYTKKTQNLFQYSSIVSDSKKNFNYKNNTTKFNFFDSYQESHTKVNSNIYINNNSNNNSILLIKNFNSNIHNDLIKKESLPFKNNFIINNQFSNLNLTSNYTNKKKSNNNLTCFYKGSLPTKTKLSTRNLEFGNQKVFLIDKYDIWTLGLIISEYFSLYKAWCVDDKGTSINTIKRYIYKKTPYKTNLSLIKDDYVKEEVEKIIKSCTEYNEFLRPSIKELKQMFVNLFEKQVLREKKIFEATKLTNNYQNLKNLDNIKETELLKLQKGLLRIGKLDLFKSIFKESKLPIYPNLKNNTFEQSFSNLENNLIFNLKKSNLHIKQELSVKKQLVIDLLIKKQTYENKVKINTCESCNNNNTYIIDKLDDTTFMIYYYMTYCEYNDCIYISTFNNIISMKLYSNVTEKIFGKNTFKYRNPYCINYDNCLFLIGGLVMSNDINLNLEQLDLYSSYSTVNKNLFGCNYVPTNRCFIFDSNNLSISSKVNIYPYMQSKRYRSSAIFINGELWVIGGGNKSIEILNYKQYKTNVHNNQKLEWIYGPDLDHDVSDPILIFKDNILIVINGEQKSLKLGKKVIEYFYLNFNLNKNLCYNTFKDSKFSINKNCFIKGYIDLSSCLIDTKNYDFNTYFNNFRYIVGYLPNDKYSKFYLIFKKLDQNAKSKVFQNYKIALEMYCNKFFKLELKLIYIKAFTINTAKTIINITSQQIEDNKKEKYKDFNSFNNTNKAFEYNNKYYFYSYNNSDKLIELKAYEKIEEIVN